MSNADGRKVLVAAALLAAIWIAVYWLWEAEPREPEAAGIRFDAPAEASPESQTPAARSGSLATRPAVGETLSERPRVDPGAPPLAGEGGTLEQLMRRDLERFAGGAPDAEGVARDGAAEDAQRGAEGDAGQGDAPAGEAAPDGPLVEDGVLVPTYSEYVVRQGDELFGIARRLYGETRHWQAIAKFNDFDPMRPLRVGQVLRIPDDPNNLQGIPVDPETGEPLERSEPVIVEPEPTEYTVMSGDNLSRIAQMFYGRATQWRRIYDANRDVLSSPDSLKVGMKLRIPPPPDTAARAGDDDG